LSGGGNHTGPDIHLMLAKAFGADEIFVKPVDMATIIAKLEQHCKRGVDNPV